MKSNRGAEIFPWIYVDHINVTLELNITYILRYDTSSLKFQNWGQTMLKIKSSSKTMLRDCHNVVWTLPCDGVVW
jgi:hypothetical protein